jgi:hypothetical protein
VSVTNTLEVYDAMDTEAEALIVEALENKVNLKEKLL